MSKDSKGNQAQTSETDKDELMTGNRENESEEKMQEIRNSDIVGPDEIRDGSNSAENVQNQDTQDVSSDNMTDIININEDPQIMTDVVDKHGDSSETEIGCDTSIMTNAKEVNYQLRSNANEFEPKYLDSVFSKNIEYSATLNECLNIIKTE